MARVTGEVKILGYFLERGETDLRPNTVFVGIYSDGEYLAYSPTEQHCKADRGYIRRCKRITREEFKQAARGFYVPADYL